MRLALLLAALTLPLQAIEFEGPREVTDFSSIYRQLLPADLDGDGDQDLLAAGFLSVTWYRNTGSGRFERAGYRDYVAEASKIELADFNGDSLPDLLLHGRALDEQGVSLDLQIHFSSGMTGFRGPVAPVPGLGDRYAVGDVDANGLADLVGSDRTYLNPGGPAPETVARSASADDIEVDQVYVQDVAGNGLPDLVKLNGEYWQNLGGGVFSDLKSLVVPDLPEFAGKQVKSMVFMQVFGQNGRRAVALMADEEDDTKAELALFLTDGMALMDTMKLQPQGKRASGWITMSGSGAGEILGQFSMMSKDGNSDDMRTMWLSVTDTIKKGYQLVGHTLTSTGSDSTSATLYHDMDGDGFKDLVLAGEVNYGDSAFLRMHRGKKGNQVNAKAEMIDAPGNGDLVKSLIDLDGDGDLDLVTDGWTLDGMQGQIAWWENRGQGASFIRRVLMTKKGEMEVVAAKDLDGDGRVEVIASSHAFKDGIGKEILISEALGGGERRVRTILSRERKIDYPKRVELGDWDGDSIDDLLVWDYATVNGDPYSERVRWMRGLPGKRFAKPVFLGQSDDQRLYDVDDDGDLDLAGYAGVEFAGVGWQEHTNAGLVPRSFPAIAGVTKPLSPALADLDNDGRPDFVAGAVPVLAKAGGVFQALPAFPVEPSGEVRSWFADLDGDGDADGVVASIRHGAQLDLTENLGGGNFAALEPLETLPVRSYHPITVLAGDIDGDGKTDLVVSTVGVRSRVEWLKRK